MAAASWVAATAAVIVEEQNIIGEGDSNDGCGIMLNWLAVGGSDLDSSAIANG